MPNGISRKFFGVLFLVKNKSFFKNKNTPMQKIVILGGGGHARVLIDFIRTLGLYEIVGIVDSQLDAGVMVYGVAVIGDDEMLLQLHLNGIRNACIGVGSVRYNKKRILLYEKVKNVGFAVPTLIHPKSIISESAVIEEGAQIMAGAIVGPNVFIGENSIINTAAIIEHDSKIGAHVHICPGAIVCGGCVIGEGTFVGVGATIIQGIKVGNKATIAARALVINDISDDIIVKGLPAK